MATEHSQLSQQRWWWRVGQVLLLGLTLFVSGCETSGDIDDLAPPDSSDRVVEASVRKLLELYVDALRNEDIDRLQRLLDPTEGSPVQNPPSLAAGMAMLSPDDLREEVTDVFKQFSVSDVRFLEVDMALDADLPSVSFWEFRSVEGVSDLDDFEQQTRVSRMVFQLARRADEAVPDVTSLLITAVARQESLVRVTLSGQIQPEATTEVKVQSLEGIFAINELEIKAVAPDVMLEDADCMAMPGASVAIETIRPATHFRGNFTSPRTSGMHFLCVRVRSGAEDVTFLHPYRLSIPDVTVAAIGDSGVTSTPLFGVAVSQNGDVWFGGESEAALSLGHLLMLSEQGELIRSVVLVYPPGTDLQSTTSRILKIAFDDSERAHLLFSVENRPEGIVAHGIVISDGKTLFCQGVNPFDPNQEYPFKVLDLADNVRRESPMRDVIAAGGNDIWIFGSDGGLARVTDELGQGPCPDSFQIDYDLPVVIRRQEEGAEDLLTNGVAALVPSATDGVLWLGTFLGLQRLQDGQYTTIAFDRTPIFDISKIDTLEALFRAMARAIGEAKPLTKVSEGDSSLIDIFDPNTSSKEEFISSAVEDSRGRLWVGTLGGGIRRVELCDGMWRDTLHLTRTQMKFVPCEGEPRPIRREGEHRQRVFLGSNIIVALAADQNDDIWVATTEGVSRIRENDEELTVTNITALDGLTGITAMDKLTASKVQDMAIGKDGNTVWLATNTGPFRITRQGAKVTGTVSDIMARPVMGADVTVAGTPFQAVTDEMGHFVLPNLPRVTHNLHIAGARAADGPFTTAYRKVELMAEDQTLPPIVLTHREPAVEVNPELGGMITFPTVPGAVLDILPDGVEFPAGVTSKIALTLLPLDSPPLPPEEGRAGIAVAMAELHPDRMKFQKQFGLTLPVEPPLSAESFVVLRCLRLDPLTYADVPEIVQVSGDGTTVTASVSLSQCPVVVFEAF